MSVENKNNNQNKFFKNMPEGLLQDSLPTMRSIIILLEDDQDDEKVKEEASYSLTPSR